MKTCAICEEPATLLDMHYPYMQQMSRCKAHEAHFCDTCALFRPYPVNQCGRSCKRAYSVEVCDAWTPTEPDESEDG